MYSPGKASAKLTERHCTLTPRSLQQVHLHGWALFQPIGGPNSEGLSVMCDRDVVETSLIETLSGYMI